MDKITARIEKDLVSKRFEYLMRLPPGIRLQLKRIEDIVFELWKLDSVFTGQIRIDCLNSCLKSRLTLGQLEDILKSEGKDLVKYEFPRALKRIVRSANRVKRGKVNSFETLKQLLSGKVA